MGVVGVSLCFKTPEDNGQRRDKVEFENLFKAGRIGTLELKNRIIFPAICTSYAGENGQVTDMIRDVVLAGNVFETLYSIDAIGNDLTIPPRGGGCGKGGQGVPVSIGSPHIRIRNAVVGGR